MALVVNASRRAYQSIAITGLGCLDLDQFNFLKSEKFNGQDALTRDDYIVLSVSNFSMSLVEKLKFQNIMC